MVTSPKSARKREDIQAAYQDLGSHHARCRDVGLRLQDRQGGRGHDRRGRRSCFRRRPAGHNYDQVTEIIANQAAKSEGRITVKRHLAVVRVDGDESLARNLRRSVDDAKEVARRQLPGDTVVFDWARGSACALSPSPAPFSSSALSSPGAGSASLSALRLLGPRPPWPHSPNA